MSPRNSSEVFCFRCATVFDMRFFTLLRGSFYGPDAYLAVRGKSAGSALSYALLAAVIVAIYPVISIATVVYQFAGSEFVDKVAEIYPEELVITMKDGVISTNVEEPYFIDIPAEWGDLKKEDFKHLVVFDTKRDVSIDEIEEYRSAVVVTDTHLYAQDEREMRAVDMSESKDNFEISREAVTKFANAAKPIVKGVIIALPFLLAVFVVGFQMIGYFIIGLLAALIVMLIAKLNGFAFTYGESYVVALYAFIPVAFLDAFTDILSAGNMFLLSALAFVIIVATNLSSAKDQPRVAA